MPTTAELHFETLWLEQWPQLDLFSEHPIDAYVVDWQQRYAENKRCKCYRSDFVSEEAKVIIEIEGRWHRQWDRFYRDILKYNLASYAGYLVIRITPEMITVAEVQRIGKLIVERSNYAQAS